MNDILQQHRNDGLNHVETYVFWNIREPFYDVQTVTIVTFKNLPIKINDETCTILLQSQDQEQTPLM